MSREVSEWIGACDDSQIPARVKVRVFDASGGSCADCGVAIRGAIRPAYDHKTAIINGGSNRESNLQLLCVPCHALKTKADVAEKSITYRKRAKHLGLVPARQKIQSAGFRKAPAQRSASRPIERRS
jgi:5-methylcytosine-specific restriction endonuclease McrA